MTTVVHHRYTPRGAALKLFKCKASEVLIAGPAGTGKSRSCLEKLHQLALRNPGLRGLIVRFTATSLTATALMTWERDVVHSALLDGSVWFHGGSAREPAGYRYSNGSFVGVGGLDQPSKIMSTEYDVIYMQEATEHGSRLEGWQALKSRLRNGRLSFQQLMADCNPDAEEHWLKQRCNDGTTVFLHSRHEDNPVYYNEDGTLTEAGDAYINGILGSLTGVQRLRLLDGQWVGAEGMIYLEWDAGVHLLDRMPKGWETWKRWWAIDWGVTNPFVCQCWAEDGDGRLYLYREFYMTGRPVEDHADEIMRVVTTEAGLWCEPKPVGVICDHDPGDREVFARRTGLNMVPAKKEVSIGIQAFSKRLQRGPDGKPRLFICKNALVRRDPSLRKRRKPTCTAEEIPGYIWREGKDEPVKENDHGCDAGRYMVAHRDLRGKVRGGYL